MKGFVMSLQKKGMVHHSVLVEQVRATRSESQFHVSGAASNVTLAAFGFFLVAAFQPRHLWQRCVSVLQPAANRQHCAVWEEVSAAVILW